MSAPDSNEVALYVAMDEAELREIRKQARDFAEKRRQTGFENFAKFAHAERLVVMDGIKQYGLSSIRILLILNGGALVAVLGLISSLFARGETGRASAAQLANAALPSFYWFVAGLVCAAVSSGVAYINFSASGMTHMSPGELLKYMLLKDVLPQSRKYDTIAKVTAWLSVAAAALGLAAFVVGCILVGCAFAVLGS